MGWKFDANDEYIQVKIPSKEDYVKETWIDSLPVPKPPKIVRRELIGHIRFIQRLRELAIAGWSVTKVTFAESEVGSTNIYVSKRGYGTEEKVSLAEVYLKAIYEK